MATIAFDNSYARLPGRFFARLDPTPVRAPQLVRLNETLAASLGLDPQWLAGPQGVAMMAGNAVPEGAFPIATAYAGHQFGGFSPQLGDGRAILLGEVLGRDGRRYDIQLKGSGPTPFSRNGDGRAALGPVLREYIVSEAMAVLGVPTTRALAAVTTGQPVRRQRALPGAVLTRVASSHIRIGTFQFFAARGDAEALAALTDHVVARHYTQAAGHAVPALGLLEAVIAAQARLVAQWMTFGFIHGVMNTDNMSIAGETIDYGPCAFMDAYDPATVFSSIDERGRYAYGNQPPMALWNLTRLAEALLPLLSVEEDAAIAMAQEALGGFWPVFQSALLAGFRRKLGLAREEEGDFALVRDLLEAMQRAQADFTATFRSLAEDADPRGQGTTQALFGAPEVFEAWAERWRQRLGREVATPQQRAAAMRLANPRFIPRNHRVEAALEAAVEHGDFAPFETLMAVLARPFDEQPEHADYALAPQPHERVAATFCGT